MNGEDKIIKTPAIIITSTAPQTAASKTIVQLKPNTGGRDHTCLRSVESEAGEARSFISSAKDRGGLSDPSLSPIRSFRIALETNGRHTVQHERKKMSQ